MQKVSKKWLIKVLKQPACRLGWPSGGLTLDPRLYSLVALVLSSAQLHVGFKMATDRGSPISASSILLDIELPGKKQTAYLLDPFLPLLRGLDNRTRVTLSRPRAEPYIVAADSPYETPGPTPARAQKDSHRPAKRLRATDNLANLEHAKIKDDIREGIDIIRAEWIRKSAQCDHREWWSDSELLHRPSYAQLAWLPREEIEASDSKLDWASLTRGSIEHRQAWVDSNRLPAIVSEYCFFVITP